MSIHDFQHGNEALRQKLNSLVGESNQLATLRGDNQFISVTKGPGGSVVRLMWNAVLARLPHLAQGGVIPVLVKSNGGSDGTRDAYATWAYDLYAIGDTGYTTKLNTSGALQPLSSPARIAKWSVTKAADGSVGLALYQSGAIVLYSCQETVGTQANCT